MCWSTGWGSGKDVFQYHSFLSVLSAYKSFQDGQKPRIDLSIFKDSICLISVTAVGLCDIKPIPLEPEYPSIGIIATIISNIASKKFIRIIPRWVGLLLIYLLALIPAIVISRKRSRVDNFIVVLSGPVFFVVLFYLFKSNGVWIDWSLPLFAFFATHSIILLYDFLLVVLEKQYFYKMSITDDQTKLYKRIKIRDHIIRLGEEVMNITASFGVASYLKDDDDESIVERADKGLYKAKNLGKNRVETIEPLSR